MQQLTITGNHFQHHMWAKFNVDNSSTLASMANAKGRENLVYGYIMEIASLFHLMRYGLQENPIGLYSDYDTFKRHFVRYWRNALDISKADLDEIRDIFDEEISSQESCKNRAITSVFFDNGKALMIEDCLCAIYEVLKMA